MQKSFFDESGLEIKQNLKGDFDLIFLDTETTDATPDARLVQLAYKSYLSGEVINKLFKPPVSISIMSMSICHITNKMVEDKPGFEISSEKDKLDNILKSSLLVAHNAPFDIQVLRNEGVETMRSIDTLRLSRHLLESDSYKLQYLRYFLDIDIDGRAHDALGDVLVLEQLFFHLKELMGLKYPDLKDDREIFEMMLELSSTPVLLTKFMFGKYRGKTFEEVSSIDSRYLDWLYSSELSKPEHEQNEDLLYTLAEYI